MGRRQTASELYRFTVWVILFIAAISCFLAYYGFRISLQPNINTIPVPSNERIRVNDTQIVQQENGCCRGIEHLELWGDAVKWGSDFKLNSSEECCKACKDMCNDDGHCLCDSWVFCGNKEACGSRFGECWLKKQVDTLEPDRIDSGDKIPWTSGLIFGKREGIVQLNTVHGDVHVKLLPECAPHSVAYILEMLSLPTCAGCQFYRAESRGNSWDSQGNHIAHASFGPPYALIQGTFEAHGTVFKDIPQEFSPTIRRGSISWVGSGPDFFISLANHNEWKKTYTVFGNVVPEDMAIVEKISQLPTRQDAWSNVKVSVLKRPVPLELMRRKKSP